MAFSVWADGIIPVDEFSIPLCIADDDSAVDKCKAGTQIKASKPGANYYFADDQ